MTMTKSELIEAMKVWLGRIEDGEIFDDVEMDDNVLSRAAGEESNFEAEKVLDEYDKMAGRTRDQKEAPDDPDIAEAQNIIKENNDGREACLTK